MKKMLFSAIAMVAFTMSANAQKNDHFINVGDLNLHYLGGATSAVAELIDLNIDDVVVDGKSLYQTIFNNSYNACTLDSKNSKQTYTISK